MQQVTDPPPTSRKALRQFLASVILFSFPRYSFPVHWLTLSLLWQVSYTFIAYAPDSLTLLPFTNFATRYRLGFPFPSQLSAPSHYQVSILKWFLCCQLTSSWSLLSSVLPMFKMEVDKFLSHSQYALPVGGVLILAILVFAFGFKTVAEPTFERSSNEEKKKKHIKVKTKVEYTLDHISHTSHWHDFNFLGEENQCHG